MTENQGPAGALRYIAAAILGCITGTILFLVVALFIGFFNDRAKTSIPINLLVAENITSALLLVILIAAGIAYFCWKVKTTPPTKETPD